MGDSRLVIGHFVIISATQPNLILHGGAGRPNGDEKVARPLVKNRQHFPARVEISQHGRGGGAGKVRCSDGRALQGEGVRRNRPTNRREGRNRDAV